MRAYNVIVFIFPLESHSFYHCTTYSGNDRMLSACSVTFKDTSRRMLPSRLTGPSEAYEGDFTLFKSLSDEEILNEDELDEETLAVIESEQPSEWDVMKNLLGINLFTYILVAAIIFFGGMNIFAGPGWLGNKIGIEGTGYFEETSNSLPEVIDLSKTEYLIK